MFERLKICLKTQQQIYKSIVFSFEAIGQKKLTENSSNNTFKIWNFCWPISKFDWIERPLMTHFWKFREKIKKISFFVSNLMMILHLFYWCIYTGIFHFFCGKIISTNFFEKRKIYLEEKGWKMCSRELRKTFTVSCLILLKPPNLCSNYLCVLIFHNMLKVVVNIIHTFISIFCRKWGMKIHVEKILRTYVSCENLFLIFHFRTLSISVVFIVISVSEFSEYSRFFFVQ